MVTFLSHFIIGTCCNLVPRGLLTYILYETPGGGGTPLYQVYRYVPQRVWFLSRFGLKSSIDFEHFGLKLGMHGYRGNIHESL